MRVANSNFINRPVRVSQPDTRPILAIYEFNHPCASILAEWDAKFIRMKNSDLRNTTSRAG